MQEPKTKRQAYTKFLLQMLLAGSVLYIGGLFHPRSTLRLAKVLRRFTKQELRQLRRALRNLERQRVIRLVEQGEDTEIQLTQAGRRQAEKLRLQDLEIPKPKVWDGKWHLVLFDVPEYLKVGRDALRNILNRLGLYQIQKSVFVYPYPCEREVSIIADSFEFENYVHCFTIEVMKPSYQEHLMRHFGLAGER